MDAMHKLISFASGPPSVMPHLVGMSVLALILIIVASKLFRYE